MELLYSPQGYLVTLLNLCLTYIPAYQIVKVVNNRLLPLICWELRKEEKRGLLINWLHPIIDE